MATITKPLSITPTPARPATLIAKYATIVSIASNVKADTTSTAITPAPVAVVSVRVVWCAMDLPIALFQPVTQANKNPLPSGGTYWLLLALPCLCWLVLSA